MIGNWGLSELLLVTIVVLLVFGPHRLPELARQAGKLLAQLRRARYQLGRQTDKLLTAAEHRGKQDNG